MGVMGTMKERHRCYKSPRKDEFREGRYSRQEEWSEQRHGCMKALWVQAVASDLVWLLGEGVGVK